MLFVVSSGIILVEIGWFSAFVPVVGSVRDSDSVELRAVLELIEETLKRSWKIRYDIE